MENGQPVTTYDVAASPGNAGTVMVQDDDSLPIIAIEADSGEVLESTGMVMFKLTATGLSADNYLFRSMRHQLRDGHDFITDAVADNAVDFSVDFSDPDGDSVYNGEFSRQP